MTTKIREGYKQTEVGVIPEDWEFSELRDYFSFISYGFTNPMPTMTDGVYMITANDINNGRLKLETSRKTSELAFKTLLSDKSRPKKNDILLTKDGTLGRLALVGNDKICINQSVAVIRPNIKIYPLFLKLLLEGTYYQKTMIDNAGGSTIKHIYITVVDKMNVAIPPTKSEQTAIASALNDADALITSLEKLIEKKRAIKQGAMQELLKPKEGWVMKTLGEIATIVRGASPRPIEDPKWFDEQSSIGWVRISDVTKSNKFLLETTQKLSEIGIKNSRYVETGNLIMSICATVGRPILTKIDVCIHDGFVVFRNPQISKEYLYYFLNFIERDWAKNGQTGSQMNLNTNLINSTKIPFPKEESIQTRIATILSDMDAEITALEQKLGNYKLIKQGMMQELLTGKIRLI